MLNGFGNDTSAGGNRQFPQFQHRRIVGTN
jgi:hypothetical protein